MTKPISRKMAIDCLLYRFFHIDGVTLLCVCGQPVLPGQAIQLDHIHADCLGGPHEFQNIRPIHAVCHRKKSARDVKDNAKVKRIVCGKKRRGRKLQGRGFDKKLTKAFGGKVRLRNG